MKIQKGSIQIIDRNKERVALLENVLREAGFKNISSATEFQGPKQHQQRFQPDLFLVDLKLLLMNDCKTLKEFGLVERQSSLPFIAIGNGEQGSSRQKVLEKGVRDIIDMPYDSIETFVRVRNGLELSMMKNSMRPRSHANSIRIHREVEEVRLQLKEEMERNQEMEKRLTEFTQTLKKNHHEIQNFSVSVSFYLQESMRKTMAFCDRLEYLESEKMDDQGKEYMRRLQKSVSKLQALINDLIQYSEVVSDFKPRQATDLNSLVRECLDNLKDTIQKTGAKIEIDYLPIIHADAFQMRQLFTNLFSNAMIYHRPNVPPLLKISSHPCDDYNWEIVVKDNGKGFSQEKVQKIFQPFERLDNTQAIEGTGIGLALCQKIVQLHDGTIEAESQPGKGSAFKVRLPENQEYPAKHGYSCIFK